jgi:HPt (histidine-containing phosphotransfer) domain-containing protein
MSDAALPDELQAKLAKLREAFADSLNERLGVLDAAIAEITANPPADQQLSSLQDLRNAAHKLAGTSGTFGYPDLGNAAFQLEEICDGLLAAAVEIGVDDQAKLSGMVAKCHESAQV